jgi:hypothetical protein
MSGEHLYDLRSKGYGDRSEANAAGDELQHVLGDAWAIGMVVAAYDHVLFHPWRPGEEMAWNGALSELLGARSRILAEVIPQRLRSYREWNLPTSAFLPLSK